MIATQNTPPLSASTVADIYDRLERARDEEISACGRLRTAERHVDRAVRDALDAGQTWEQVAARSRGLSASSLKMRVRLDRLRTQGPTRLVTVPGAARLLGVPKAQVRDLLERGRLSWITDEVHRAPLIVATLDGQVPQDPDRTYPHLPATW